MSVCRTSLLFLDRRRQNKQEIGERQRVSALLDACSRSERALRERVDATASEGDLKARLASARSELEAVSLERNALVRPPSPYGWFLVLLSGTGGCANGRLPRAAREFRSDKLVGDW